MKLHDFVLIIIAFLSELVGTISGFGSSTFFIPLASLVEKFQFAMALTAILHCFGNIFRIWLFRRNFELKAVLKFALPSIALTGIGALLATMFSASWLVNFLGLVLILITLLSWISRFNISYFPNWSAFALISFSGFTTGLVGTGGAIRGIALTAVQLPKNSFVVTSASIDIIGDLLRTLIYLKNGFMDWQHWFYIPLLGLAAFIGTKIGQILLNKIDQDSFNRIVSFFIFVSGIIMLFE